MGVQYRYLSQSDSGTFNGNLLPDDQRLQEQTAAYVHAQPAEAARQHAGSMWTVRTSATLQYFEDFTQGTESTSTPFLPRSLLVSHRDDIWNLRAQMQSVPDPGYRQPGRVRAAVHGAAAHHRAGLWSPKRWPLLNLSLDSEVVNFTRSCDTFAVTEADSMPPAICPAVRSESRVPSFRSGSGQRLAAQRPAAGRPGMSGSGLFLPPERRLGCHPVRAARSVRTCASN